MRGGYARSWPVQGERKETGVCVVIPVLNEEEAIAGVLERDPPRRSG